METLSPSHPAIDLAKPLYYQLVYTLTGLLPPPIDDTPQALRARNEAAIAKVAALLPVNANEYDLAAQCIAARAQAEDVLRLLRQNAGDIGLVMRLNAQYGSMVRTSLSVHARLMRVQALRQKREAIEGAADEDAPTQHIAERSIVRVADPDAAPFQPASPHGARAERPHGARAERPHGARVERPDGARAERPDGVRAERPEGARAERPKAAPVATRPDPPAARADQRTQKSVSENVTDSQDAAFETWLSEQPWNQVPKGSGETNLRRFVSALMAGTRSAGRELPADGRESPGTADQARQIDRQTAST